MIPLYDRNAMYESRKLDFDLAWMAGWCLAIGWLRCLCGVECDTWKDGSRC
jgi:hypothetical protein